MKNKSLINKSSVVSGILSESARVLRKVVAVSAATSFAFLLVACQSSDIIQDLTDYEPPRPYTPIARAPEQHHYDKRVEPNAMSLTKEARALLEMGDLAKLDTVGAQLKSALAKSDWGKIHKENQAEILNIAIWTGLALGDEKLSLLASEKLHKLIREDLGNAAYPVERDTLILAYRRLGESALASRIRPGGFLRILGMQGGTQLNLSWFRNQNPSTLEYTRELNRLTANLLRAYINGEDLSFAISMLQGEAERAEFSGLKLYSEYLNCFVRAKTAEELAVMLVYRLTNSPTFQI